MSDGFTARWVVVSNALPALIANLGARVESVVAKAATDIEAMAKSLAPVDTGTLRNSIQANKTGPGAWLVTVGVDYGLYVEWGTARMAAQPYLGPAVAHVRPSFMEAMRQVVTM